jgi:uncharacterized repeat protein (TIGR03803 family)
MTNSEQHRSSISGKHLRLPAALALAVLLAPAMLANLPAQAQTFTVLYNFTGSSDGAFPETTLVTDEPGNLYGTAAGGGSFGSGVVFKVDPSGNETVLYSFTGGTDGGSPAAGLQRDIAGILYGTTQVGGPFGNGVAFQLDINGVETLLHKFTGGIDGGLPVSVLLHGFGVRYGTAPMGGASGNGVVYQLSDSKGSKLTVLHNFNGSDGAGPTASLIRDTAGNLYGTTEKGGSSGNGVVFELDLGGNETVLYNFTGGTDGGSPYAGLVLAGSFLYGTTVVGGTFGNGVVFKVDRTSGVETVLHNFTGGSDGGSPFAGLLLAGSHLYGTTLTGGTSGDGVVFKVDTSRGKETILHSFTGTDGAGPFARLLRDSVGNLYGTTQLGGAFNNGVVFKITP